MFFLLFQPNTLFTCPALNINRQTLLDMYHQAMAKESGKFTLFVELLALKIIGEDTLVHCTPAASAKDVADIREPIPMALRTKMMSKF